MTDLEARARTSLGSARFRAVVAASLLIMTGFGLIVPALPQFARRFGVEEAGIGLLLTVFGATRLVGDLFAGALIDRFGERTMAALGAVIVGVSSFSAGAAGSFGALVALRGAGGIGSAFFLGGLMAYLIGTIPSESRGRAMSIFQASIGIGLLIGPLFGGLIMAWTSENMPLYVYGVICIACAPLVIRAMGPERVPSSGLADAPPLQEPGSVPSPPARAWSRLAPLLGDPTYRAALAISGLSFFLTTALQGLLPIYWSETLKGSQASSGIPFTVMALAGIVVVWHAGSLSDRRGRKYALIPALAFTVIAMAGLMFTGSTIAVVALMALFGVASGYTRPGPTAMVADLAPPDARGVAVSGYRIAGDAGAFVGPVLVGAIAEWWGHVPAFGSLAAVAAVVLLLATRARETAPGLAGVI